MVSRRNRERKYYIRRQVLLLCTIAVIVVSLFWLVQANYALLPVQQEVLAERENSPDQPASSIIWQGSRSYIIAKHIDPTAEPINPIAEHIDPTAEPINPTVKQIDPTAEHIDQVGSYSSYRNIHSNSHSLGNGRLLYCLYSTQQQTSRPLSNLFEEYCVKPSTIADHQGKDQNSEKLPADNAEDGTEELGKKPGSGSELDGTAKTDQELSYAGQVYLTFDDGPSQLTAPILDILAETGLGATFFVLGEMVEKHPQLTQRIVNDGHSIGNHSYNHRYSELYKSGAIFVDQVLKTSRAIYDTTGIVTPLFRAPGGTFGNFDESYMNALNSAGYLVFDWNVDSRDSSSRHITADEIIGNVTEAPLKERMIVLMHDSATHETTLEALPAIIEYFQQMNYEFIVINDTTDPITSPLAKTLKWQRSALTEKQANRLKFQTELLLAEAMEQQSIRTASSE